LKALTSKNFESINAFKSEEQSKAGRLPARTPTPSGKLLLVAWESYMTPCWPECTKIPPETGGYSNFLIEKLPNKAIFDKNH
jgi:hypothetical protein